LGLIYLFKELMAFIRFRIVAGIALLAAYGSLLNGGGKLLEVTLTAFLIFATIYSANNLTDVDEDKINRKRLNYFSTRTAGRAVVIMTALLGLASALTLPMVSLAAYVLIAVASVAYSFLRVKKVLLVKNVYTAFFITLAFAAGSLSTGLLGKVLVDSAVMFFYVLMGTVIADIRDVEGDSNAGIRTVPVTFGKRTTGAMMAVVSAGIVASVVSLHLVYFYPIVPFLLVMLALLAADRIELAHVSGTAALLALIAFALLY